MAKRKGLNKQELEVIKRFVNELKKVGIKIYKVILFGSRAYGNAHEFSDIDIGIVSEDFDKDPFLYKVKLRKIAVKIDPRLDPVAIPLESYLKNTWIPLIYEIRTKGKLIKI